MELKPVEKSSSIKAFGFDESTRNLRVEFNNGARYDHPDFNPEMARAFDESPSKGSYYAQIIRPLGIAVLLPPDPPKE